ncbi:MAG: chemotaxis protein CheD [Fimbriimonadaceae bacterium]|nr:chemotaxis protein CheD [Fimbriimonadaceae bacterium]QYK56184.1 MAG: chemotaxis protein CheD [Fimbriimonadaceae bacterium]
MAASVMVGMADLQVSDRPIIYSCLGLGSCIGLLAYDPTSRVSAMVHIMLPEAFKDKPVDKPGKFADTGLPALAEGMAKLGADMSKVVVAYAGGAQVFRAGNADPSSTSRLDVGARNSVAVEKWLREARWRVVAFDVGGGTGRTMIADLTTGVVKVKTIHKGEQQLCSLRV